MCRLPENTPAQIALKEAQRKTKRPKGSPKTTFLQQLQKDLPEKDIYNISSATELLKTECCGEADSRIKAPVSDTSQEEEEEEYRAGGT